MDLREFLNNVVGMGSIDQNEDGHWMITPYELVTSDRNRINITGHISFKGQRFQEFTCTETDLRTVMGMVESLNHGYTQAIKDVVENGVIGSTIKPFKFV